MLLVPYKLVKASATCIGRSIVFSRRRSALEVVHYYLPGKAEIRDPLVPTQKPPLSHMSKRHSCAVLYMEHCYQNLIRQRFALWSHLLCRTEEYHNKIEFLNQRLRCFVTFPIRHRMRMMTTTFRSSEQQIREESSHVSQSHLCGCYGSLLAGTKLSVG